MSFPHHLENLVIKIGESIRLARYRRRQSLREFAERIEISPNTLSRLERGDPSVGLGIFLYVLDQLEMLGPIESLTRPEADEVGLAQEKVRALSKKGPLKEEFDF